VSHCQQLLKTDVHLDIDFVHDCGPFWGIHHCAEFVCLFGDSVCTSHETHRLSTYRSPFLNLHGLSRAYRIPVKGFLWREKKKDLLVFKINLSEESEED
jgi:hypothetical protein